MSSICMYAKTKDSSKIVILSDLNYEIPLSNLLLVSGNTITVTKEQCFYGKSIEQPSHGAVKGDFALGYKSVFDFLQMCLDRDLIDAQTHKHLAKDTHKALDKLLEQDTSVYLEVIGDDEFDSNEEDMCSLIAQEVQSTAANLNEIIDQLKNIVAESGSDDLLKAIGFQWAN